MREYKAPIPQKIPQKMDFYIREVTRAFSRESILGAPVERDAADATADARPARGPTHRHDFVHSTSASAPAMNRDTDTVENGGGFRLAVDQISAQNNRPIKCPGIRGIRTVSAVTIRGRRILPRAYMAPSSLDENSSDDGGESRGTILPQITST